MSRAAGGFRVREASSAGDFTALHALREQVFVHEQQVPVALERDALDAGSHHVLAEDAGGRVIGTARLTPLRSIGRMAVLPQWRGRGVGGALLHALLRQAADRGWSEVGLHAQAHAIGFYRDHGFREVGEPFVEAGIDHRAMQLRLDRPLAVDDLDGAIAASAAVIGQARRRLVIHSRRLDPGLYDAPAVLAALRAFASARREVEVRVLLHDALAAQRALSPVIALGQRLPSVFAFREVDDPVDRNDATACLASDAGGWFHRPFGHRFEGEWMFSGAARARQIIAGFDPVWERSRPCTELRALGI